MTASTSSPRLTVSSNEPATARAKARARVAAEGGPPASAEANESLETRDYYRVQDETGGRYWLYRAGLYQGSKPPRWFLHGVFA